jgi:RNA polymerase sigma-70 factor (ECF subfamily)
MADASTTQLQQWIERMNAGDPDARDALLAHARDRLRRLTHKLLHDDFRRLRRWEDTDDVLQNASLRLLRALQAVPLGSVAEFFRLAAQLIRRELLDLIRHHFGPEGPAARLAADGEPTQSEPGSPANPERSDTTHEPAGLASWREFHEQVEALPVEERTVFDLLWYQGLTQAEAAAVLNISLATLKRRWLAARLRLQDRLPGEHPGD